jgi:hypothetical protein
MAILYEQIGAEISTIKSAGWQCDWNQTLHYCRTELISNADPYQPTPEDNLLYDVLIKFIKRGDRPFPSHFTEECIAYLYGGNFSLEKREQATRGSIVYSYDQRLPELYRSFSDVLSPWTGEPSQIAFDPTHPENERELFRRLVERFGPRIAHCIAPQAEVSMLLPANIAGAFAAQRVDFLLSFPNGKKLLIEPGDHDTPEQIIRDRQRDTAFEQLHIKTFRPRNTDIGNPEWYEEIARHLEELNVKQFLQTPTNAEMHEQHALNHLFLLPTLIVRMERLLAHFFLRQGLVHRTELRIGIIEQDLECTELAVASFLHRLSRLARLYGVELAIPQIQLCVRRSQALEQTALEQLQMPIQICESFDDLSLDILLDVGMKCNVLTEPVSVGAPHIGSVRQTFPHNRPVRFGYIAQARPIVLNDETESMLESFVQDFFRKYALRPGQLPILQNILSQKATIGLLPTSAGKSLCYQLAALLTPGTTIVVDPIVALMQDQVQSLVEQFGISRVLAWHAGAGLHDQNVDALLGEHIMVFISPERLQRPQFRAAMRALGAADIFINYAVIDEAHCVSMWGHDFRPSYLTLERNFRSYCTFQGRAPVLVALTGTASQLVLIDLKRELNIEDMEAVIRPNTFDRPELNFNLVQCPSGDKQETLEQVTDNIARRLNVQDLAADAHGIIFAYTRNKLWNLFGQYVGNANHHVQTVLNNESDGDIIYGIYTGSAPPDAGLNHEQWNSYKQLTLAAFKRGDINMLFGNTAVSVGIDNERLNYIINYKMPQSMEAYYQQCGRAGRAGQRSECYLIFSDDAPAITQQWLNREIPHMPQRWDDLGTIAYFHRSNFPGQDTDIEGALKVFKKIFGTPDGNGFVDVPQFLNADMTPIVAERTERYISYWLILGVLVDYEVTGMGRNTIYRVRRHDLVERFLQDRDEEALTTHIVGCLHLYLSRYRPTLRTNVEEELNTRNEPELSEKCVSFLVDFVYGEIEYQRREAIRTMVAYCNEENTSPELLRTRVRAYFDTSEKFSEGLLAMADVLPDFAAVATLLDKVEGFDDAEHLYWETRRLLDERFRPDWAVANLFTIAYRERASCSDTFMRLFDDIVADVSKEPQAQDESGFRFLGSFLTYLCRLDRIFGEPLSGPLLGLIMSRLYEQHKLTYVGLIDEINVSDEVRELMRLQVVNLQLKEIINGEYSRTIE